MCTDPRYHLRVAGHNGGSDRMPTSCVHAHGKWENARKTEHGTLYFIVMTQLIAWAHCTVADSVNHHTSNPAHRRSSARVALAPSINRHSADEWVSTYSVKRARFYLARAAEQADTAQSKIHRILNGEKTTEDPSAYIEGASSSLVAALDLGVHDGWTWVKVGLLQLRLVGYYKEMEAGQWEEGLAMIRLGLQLARENSKTEFARAFEPLTEVKNRFCITDRGPHRAKVEVLDALDQPMYEVLCSRIEIYRQQSGSDNMSIFHRLFSPQFQAPNFNKYSDRRTPSFPGSTDYANSGDNAPTPVATTSKLISPDDVEKVIQVLRRPTHIVLKAFATPISRVNFASYFGTDALDRLSEIANQKYNEFSEAQKREGITSPNDINNNFFAAQFKVSSMTYSSSSITSEDAFSWWPQLYRDSYDWHKLITVLTEGALDFAYKAATARDETPLLTREELRGNLSPVVWAAVYAEGDRGGGRHGAHTHQSSVSSCVFYSKVGNTTAPIGFYDPRGAPIHYDYEVHRTEFEWQPEAPFHQPLWLFPEAGDLICFPSWLVHTVPARTDTDTYRVAFPINLQSRLLDTWHMTATAT